MVQEGRIDNSLGGSMRKIFRTIIVSLGEAVTWGPGEWNPPNSPYTARYTTSTWTSRDNYGPGGDWRAAGYGQFDYVDSTGTHGRCGSL